MGLFGYNEKTFKINSDKYIDALIKLQTNANYLGMDSSVGKTINEIIMKVSSGEFNSNWNKGDVSKVETRILSLINSMSSDIQQKSMAKFMTHVSFLYDSLDARMFGKENRTDEQIRQMEILADGMALIEQAVLEKEACVNQQNEITSQAASLAQGDPKLDLLRIKWKDLEAQKNNLNKTIETYQNNHEANVQTANALKLGDVIDSLPTRIAEPQDLSAALNKIARKFEKENAKNVAIGETVTTFNEAIDFGGSSKVSESDEAFNVLVDSKRAEAMAGAIGNADVSASSSGSKQDDIKVPF